MAQPPDRSKWPVLASTLKAGCMLAGTCGDCKRSVRIEISQLIDLYGADAKTRDVMDRITCPACGGKMRTSVVPIDPASKT